ncbi:MAG: ABC transporter substrate-binding protein [Pseudomonadota bacterium]
MFKKIAIASIAVLALASCFYFVGTSPKNKKIVAITQIAPHPSLDRIREGITDTLKANKGEDLEIVFQNAQGNVATATQIAQRFVSLKPNVIVPITTPSAQTVYAAATGKEIPLVFVAITDPIEARLVSTNGSNIPFVTGVSDAPPYAKQVEQMQKILGKKSLNIGVIYNPGEPNSLSQIKHIEAEIIMSGGKVIQSAASSTVAVSQATMQLIGKVDAIYLPNDNTVISALTSVLKITHEHKIPIFSSDPESVERGCTAAVAPDQYQIGVQAGKIIIRLLNGEKTDTILVEKSSKISEYVNKNIELHTALGSPQH